MQSREGRIIVFSMLAGALAGGLAIMLLRMRAARQTQSEPEPLGTVVDKIHWGELFSIAAAGVALARRIGSLSEPPPTDKAKS
ncbi:MAG: hypothetical protein HZB53_20635 [Chloroflexi bacterium]|nr:hypothetical protein [Chloroflexota bacterium]